MLMIFNFLICARAQVPPQSRNLIQAVDEREHLAKEFFEVTGTKNEMLESIKFGDMFLTPRLKEKNPQMVEQSKRAYQIANARWTKKKETLANELTQQFLKKIENTFSVPELKYLIEVSKTAVFKKYNLFVKSDEFGKIFNTPSQMARAYLEDAKKEVAAPPKANK